MRGRRWILVCGLTAGLLAGCTNGIAGSAGPAPGTPRPPGTSTSPGTPRAPGTSRPPGTSTSRGSSAVPSSSTKPPDTAAGRRIDLFVTSEIKIDSAVLRQVAAAAGELLAADKIVATVAPEPPDQIIVSTAAEQSRIVPALGGARHLRLLPVTASRPAKSTDCAKPAAGPTATTLCDVAGDTVYSVAREPFELTGVTVRAQTGATGRPVLLLTFDTTTAGKLKEYTTDNVGKTVAISDGLQVISAPVINEPIVTSSLQLSGPDSAAENKAVAARMTLAALRIEIRRG